MRRPGAAPPTTLTSGRSTSWRWAVQSGDGFSSIIGAGSPIGAPPRSGAQTFALLQDYTSIRAAGLHYGSWWDSFATGTIRNFTGLAAVGAVPQRLLMGPWQHVAWSARTGEVDHGAAGAPEIDQAQLAFFDQHLRDCDGDGDGGPRARSGSCACRVCQRAPPGPGRHHSGCPTA